MYREVEADMSGAEFIQPDSFGEKTICDEVKTVESNPELLATAKENSFITTRFSSLSAQMTDLLADLSREIKISEEHLVQINRAVNRKEDELKALGEIEASAAALELVIENQRVQKEQFDCLLESQRLQWEEEKTRRMQEEEEYQQSMLARRQQDEEEYKKYLASERLKAQQKIEDELLLIQQENLERKQSFEKECIERERRLKEKELEWIRLIQELEAFMAKLQMRIRMEIATRSGAIKDLPPQSDLHDSGELQVILNKQATSAIGDLPEWNLSGESDSSLDSEPIFGKDLIEEQRPPIAAFAHRKDFMPLVFPPKKMESSC
jgi:hypothetical protein